jgi:hypothetical protein
MASLQGFDRVEVLARRRQSPVLCELLAVQRTPLENVAQSPPRKAACDEPGFDLNDDLVRA